MIKDRAIDHVGNQRIELLDGTRIHVRLAECRVVVLMPKGEPPPTVYAPLRRVA